MRELAELFQNLERTSSSSTLVILLAEFLSRLNPDEATPSPIFCAANWLRHLNRWKSAWPVELKQQ